MLRPLRALCLTLLASSAAAQPRAIPLAEALAIARAQATDVLRADARIASAEVAADAVRARRWPRLSLDASTGQRYGLGFDQTSGGLTQQTVQALDVGLSAAVTVYDGGARRAEARSAEATVQAARLGRARAEQEAAVAVLNGYLAAAQAAAARTVALEDVAAQRDLLAEVAAQVDLGERASSERAQQEERVAAAQAAVLAADRDGALAAVRLARTLGLDPLEEATFPTPDLPAAPAPAPAAALVARALSGRADLRAATLAVDAAEIDMRAARASRRPQVVVGGSVGTSYTSAADAGFPGQLGGNRAGGLSLGVSLPLFDQGATRARVGQAAARAAALRTEAEDARRAVAASVREALVEVEARRVQAAVATARVAAAQTAADAERARFQAGETTLQSVSLARARLVEAQTDRARLEVEARFARLLLDVAVGD